MADDIKPLASAEEVDELLTSIGRRPAVTDPYRKKPVVVQAMRFGAYTEALPSGDLYAWLTESGCSFQLDQIDPGPCFLMIHTLEGWMRANIGDWIIRSVKGEFYPCKPDIFAQTYEPERPAVADDIDGSRYYVVQIAEYDAMKAEIERLRAENNYLANSLERIGSSIIDTLRAYDEWQEARRD